MCHAREERARAAQTETKRHVSNQPTYVLTSHTERCSCALARSAAARRQRSRNAERRSASGVGKSIERRRASAVAACVPLSVAGWLAVSAARHRCACVATNESEMSAPPPSLVLMRPGVTAVLVRHAPSARARERATERKRAGRSRFVMVGAELSVCNVHTVRREHTYVYEHHALPRLNCVRCCSVTARVVSLCSHFT